MDPSGDPRHSTLYVPSLNPSRAPNEQPVGDLQEERLTTLEQAKALENIITPGEIKIYEAAQLRGLYIIKMKHGICMLETDKKLFRGK